MVLYTVLNQLETTKILKAHVPREVKDEMLCCVSQK